MPDAVGPVHTSVLPYKDAPIAAAATVNGRKNISALPSHTVHSKTCDGRPSSPWLCRQLWQTPPQAAMESAGHLRRVLAHRSACPMVPEWAAGTSTWGCPRCCRAATRDTPLTPYHMRALLGQAALTLPLAPTSRASGLVGLPVPACLERCTISDHGAPPPLL